MEQKKSFIIYYDYADTIFSELTDEEVGQLLRSIIRYERDGEITDFKDRTVRTAYKRMVSDCDANRVKYLKSCEIQRQKALKRWHGEDIE